MAGSVGASNRIAPPPSRPTVPPAAQPWMTDTRREALIKSSDMLRDRFVRSGSTLSELDRTFSNPAATGWARGTAVASASRELGNTLRTVDSLNQQLDAVMGDSPIYQRIARSGSGQAFLNSTRAAARTVAPVADVAGAMVDLSRAQTQATRDFSEMQRVLADPNATTSLKVAATARATQSASSYVNQQRAAIKAIQAADANYVSNPTYQRLTEDLRSSRTARLLDKVDDVMTPTTMKVVQAAGTGAGVVLGVITLPKLVESVKSSYEKLKTTLEDRTATQDQKLDAVADLSRASAGTIQGVEGLRLSVRGLTELAEESRFFGPLMGRVGSVGTIATAGSWFTRIMRVLSPIADVGMLVADGVKLKHTFSDPTATFWTKARAILNVGLDGLKLATWLMPQTAFLRLGYMGASFLQLGLATYDFGHSIGPALKKVGNAVVHPVETARAVGQAIGEGMVFVSNHVYSAAAALEHAVFHPAEALRAVGAKVSGMVSGAKSVGNVLKQSAVVVDNSRKGMVSPPAGAAATPVPVGALPVTP